MTLQVTLDKHDSVISASRPEGEWRWRFKPVRRMTSGKRAIKDEAVVQEMLAIYVDQPSVTATDIAQMFGLSSTGSLVNYLHAYGVPLRQPHKGNRTAHPQRTPAPQPPAPEPVDAWATVKALEPDTKGFTAPDAIPWEVTIVREITEVVYFRNLAEVEAHYGSKARIVRVVRL